MNMKKKSLLVAFAFLLSVLMIGGCTNMNNKSVPATSKYPDKPITLIVPFSVGSGMDLVARLLEKTASKQLGQPLIIVNKPGGSGTVAWNELASSHPDGYTIGMTSTEVILHPLYAVTKYNYPTALEPLVQISDTSMVMVVQSNKPWSGTTELIEYAKQHPGKIKLGHAGIGSVNHISGETFAKAANINLEQVPFQGGAEALTNLLGGHVQVIILNAATVKEHVKNGTVKVLAVAGDQRLSDPLFANIPTFKEQGFDVSFGNWYVIAAPKELPLDVKNKLTDGFNKMINDPEFKTNMNNLGLEVNYLDAKASQEKWVDENQKLSKTVQATGILDLIKAQKQ